MKRTGIFYNTADGKCPVRDFLDSLTGKGEKSFFALDQDTGSAIQTPARADVYFGIGDQPMHEAGELNAYGQLYYLLKR